MEAPANKLIDIGNAICALHKARLNFLARAFVHEFAHLPVPERMKAAKMKVRGLIMQNWANVHDWIDDNLPWEHLQLKNLKKIVAQFQKNEPVFTHADGGVIPSAQF